MAGLTLTASAKVVERVVNDLYDIALDSTKDRIRKWRTASKIKHLARKLSSVRRVKTIWQTEYETDLMDFYHPSKILEGRTRKEIRSLSDLTKEGNICIEGTVGQGKSILLRYLCTQEIYIGQHLPVFVELRQLEAGTKLVDHLLETLDLLGFGADPPVLDFLASSGKLILCLDGFDEVKQSFRNRLIHQIEALCLKYDAMRVVITSRPDNGIDKSAAFRVKRLAPLERGDLNGIIVRLTKNPDLTTEIQQAVDKSPNQIRSLLTTPLMVTLLVIAYKAEQQIPETMAEFYESLFYTLLQRHDKLKNFDRKRRSGLNDRSIRDMFDCVCFLCRKQQLVTISRDVLYDSCKKATVATQVGCDDPEKFIDDIKQITCLILEEGDKYHFIHKSIAEYHAASYIKKNPEAHAKKFYEVVSDHKFAMWAQEIDFLQQIDPYRFAKFFFIPNVRRFAEVEEATTAILPAVMFNAVVKSVSQLHAGFNERGEIRSLRFDAEYQRSWIDNNVFRNLIDVFVMSDWGEAIKRVATKSNSREAALPPHLNVTATIAMADLFKTSLVEPRVRILAGCKTASTDLVDRFHRAHVLVKHTEDRVTDFDGLV